MESDTMKGRWRTLSSPFAHFEVFHNFSSQVLDLLGIFSDGFFSLKYILLIMLL